MPYYMHELSPDYGQTLRGMSTQELQALLDQDDLIEVLVSELQQVKSAESERDALLESNRAAAEWNLSQEPVLDSLKVKISELNEELNELKKSLESKKNRLDDLTRQMSLDTTLALLQAAAAEAEEESEAFSENFLNGEIQVDSFVESYLVKRKLSHLRRVKAEKMADLLNQQTANRITSGRAPYPTEINPYCPYPFFPANPGQSVYTVFPK